MKNIKSQLNKVDKKKANKVNIFSSKENQISQLSPLIKAMALGNKNEMTKTANGAITPASSGDKVLDFFAQAGALRSKSDAQVQDIFKKACLENVGLALKALFYIRDVRGGQGERKTFRTCLKWLASTYPDKLKANLDNISFYGRWDDLFVLFDTPLEKDMLLLVNNQLFEDLNSGYTD